MLPFIPTLTPLAVVTSGQKLEDVVRASLARKVSSQIKMEHSVPRICKANSIGSIIGFTNPIMNPMEFALHVYL